MDRSLHEYTIPGNGNHQEDDQVVPDIDINQPDDTLRILAEHVLMCNKVSHVLHQ